MKKKKIWASIHPFYEGGDVFGRKIANSSFLAALLESDPYDEYHFFLHHPDTCKAQLEELENDFPSLFRRGAFRAELRHALPEALAENDYHVFHLSDPFLMFSDLMRVRNAYSRVIFPVTAPTHSLSYREYGLEFLRHLWPGTSRRDAVVATSAAGERVVSNMYAALRRAYGLDEAGFPAPAVRRVPLGVDPRVMPSPEERPGLGAAERARLDLGREVVFLVFARISYLSKMDLLPLLRAFKRAEGKGLESGSYALVLAGWTDDDDEFSPKYAELAANIGIKCRIVARPDYERRKAIFAAADVFVSPSDNLQETFGLTLVEAALASLPVVASDFNGYRDLVRHGVTGFLTPTVGPSSAPGTDAVAGIVPASEYHLRLAEQCVVELEPLASALAELGADADLRVRMGGAGRERALAEYSWPRVIRLYTGLWDELAGIALTAAEESALRSAGEPARPPYMDIFGSYYTMNFSTAAASGRMVRMSRTGEAVYRGLDFPVVYGLIEHEIDMEALRRLLFSARKPVPLGSLVSTERPGLVRGAPRDAELLVLWALKHDLLEFV